MPKLKNRLTFDDVGQALGCTTADVRALVVEEKRLPAVYVTLIGAAQTYGYQLLKVNDEGLAFDLSVGGLEGSVHTGYLRVERSALEQFRQENGIVDIPSRNIDASDEKPLGTIERKTLLTIIAAIAKPAKINIEAPGKAAVYIEGLTDELGAHVAKRTIEEHLKKIPDALETRMK